MLAGDQSGFDRLTEPDLVGQQIALDRIGEDATDGSDLMGREIDTRRDERGHPLCRAPELQQRQHRRLAAVVEKLALRAAVRQHLRGIVRSAPRAEEKLEFAEVRALPVREPHLIVD